MSGFNIEMLGGLNSISGSTTTRLNEFAVDGPAQKTATEKSGSGPTFADLLSEKLSETDQSLREANSAAEELIAGRNKDLHGAMIALEKADVSFRMLMQVRNKMIDAYREIMRMQV